MKFDFKSVDPASRDTKILVENWNSWQWQLRHSATDLGSFSKSLTLTPDEAAAFNDGKDLFSVRCTPYYLSLLGPSPQDPLRKVLVPQIREIVAGHQALLDPLGERKNNPVPRIIHRYSDRALFLITDFCSVYCRYCTRKHFTGQGQSLIPAEDYAKALSYLRERKGIREVILSGGDPLTLSDEVLARVLSDLRDIEHLEIIRIGTRMPVVCPMRITENLVRILKLANPLYMMVHFNHPRELTAEAAGALTLLADSGIPLFNQMVLLNGVNNHPAIVQALSRRLLYLRVKPYYMFQCDPSIGTDHLRTSIGESMKIQRELWGHLSGLAMPTLSVDIPEGGGKAALVPQFETATESLQTSEGAVFQKRFYQGFDGVQAEYIDPDPALRETPLDAELYFAEWEELKNAKLR